MILLVVVVAVVVVEYNDNDWTPQLPPLPKDNIMMIVGTIQLLIVI